MRDSIFSLDEQRAKFGSKLSNLVGQKRLHSDVSNFESTNLIGKDLISNEKKN